MRGLLAVSIGCALLAAGRAHAEPIVNVLMKHPPCDFAGYVDHTGFVPHERAHSDHGGTVDLASGTMRLWARTDISSAGALFSTVTAEANGHAGFTGFDCIRTGRYRVWVQSLASGLMGVHVPDPPWTFGGAGGETNNWITVTVHVWMLGSFWTPIASFNVGAASNPPRDRGTQVWEFDNAVGESMAGELDLYAGSTYALEATFHCTCECSSWGWIQGAWAAVNNTPLQDYWFAGTSYTRDGWWRLTGLGFQDVNPDLTPPTTQIANGPPGGTYCEAPGLVWLSASDGGGYGVRGIHYQMDGGPWENYIGFPIFIDRSLTLRFYSDDFANNVEPVQEHRYTIITQLATPTLLGVPDGSMGHELPVTLSWSGVTDATHYEIQLDEDPAFGSPLVGLTARTDTSLAGLALYTTYHWRVRSHNNQAAPQCAWGDWSAPWSFTVSYPLGVGDGPIPARFALQPNQPNPFKSSTSVAFDLPRPALVSLAVYAVTGERIRVLASGMYPAGQHRVDWDGRDESGHEVPSGIYFHRLTADRFRQTRRTQLLR